MRLSRKHKTCMHNTSSGHALSIGVVTKANKKALFVTLVDHIPWFETHWSPFFIKFNWFIVLTSRSGAYTSRYGDFSANDNDDNNNNDNDNTTDYFTPCACVRGKNNEVDWWSLVGGDRGVARIKDLEGVSWQLHAKCAREKFNNYVCLLFSHTL